MMRSNGIKGSGSSSKKNRGFLYLILTLFITILVLNYCSSSSSSDKEDPDKIYDLAKIYDPAFVSCAHVIPQLKPIKGVGMMKGAEIGLKASDCGACHSTIYNEWKESTHAYALQDPQYQGELIKPGNPAWVCLNCHIPIQNQRKVIIDGLYGKDVFRPVQKPNPGFDKEMREESITCGVCHFVQDKNGDTIIVGSGKYKKTAPHPVKSDPKYMKNRCYTCHNIDKSPLEEKGMTCFFGSGTELRTGPYAGKKDCVDCHMPNETRLVADAFVNIPKRKGHRHVWVGPVPKTFKGYDSLLQRGFYNGLKFKVVKATTPRPGSTMTITMAIKNSKAGHWIPTGDPERMIIVDGKLVDPSGKVVQKVRMRYGQEFEWNVFPPIRMSDNRFKPLETKKWQFSLKLPNNSLKGYKIEIVGRHVRMTSETAWYTKQAQGVPAEYADAVKNLEKVYPFSSFIYKSVIDLGTRKMKTYPMKKLIEMSKAMAGDRQMQELKHLEPTTIINY